MSSRIVIVGAGGFGREVHAWMHSSPVFRAAYRVESVVFIDDRVGAEPADDTLPSEVVSTVADYEPEPGDLLVCAIGDSSARRRVVDGLHDRGCEFATFVHDSAVVGARVRIGAGSVICPNVVITVDVILGEHVHINLSTHIGHDSELGDFVTLSPGCNIAGHVTIEDGAFVATGAIVTPGRTVGRSATVGAGSVVLRNVKARTTVFGNPAVRVGTQE